MMFPDYSFFVCHIIYTEKVMYICDRILHTYMFNVRITYAIESVQDFLIKLDMKPCMHIVEISIFSVNLVFVRLTKIMNRADKNWAQFYKIKYLKFQKFQKHFLIKVGLLVKYSS